MYLSLEVIIQSWEVMPRSSGLMENKAQENGMEGIGLLCLSPLLFWPKDNLTNPFQPSSYERGLKLAEENQNKL